MSSNQIVRDRMSVINEKYKQDRKKFIDLLPEVLISHNFDNAMIEALEKLCGFTSSKALVLFKGGMQEIVDAFIENQDQVTIEYLKTLPIPTRTREKIVLALNVRIKRFMSPIIHQKIAIYLAHPYNTMLGIKLAFRTCNTIWQYAGDTSTDFNYYSKRSLLVGVYLVSILFYISDKSENYVETEEFINQSIEKVIKCGSLKKQIKFPRTENIPILRLFI